MTIVVPSLKRPPNVKEPLRVFSCSGFPCSSWCSFVACQYLRTSNVWGGESFCEICSPFSSRSWWRMWIRRRMMQDTRRRRRHLGLGLAGAKERLALAVTCVTRRAFTMVSHLLICSQRFTQPVADELGFRPGSPRTQFDLATSQRECLPGVARVRRRPHDFRGGSRSDQPSLAGSWSPVSSCV